MISHKILFENYPFGGPSTTICLHLHSSYRPRNSHLVSHRVLISTVLLDHLLLFQMLLDSVLFPLGLELLGRGFTNVFEPVLQIRDFVYTHESRNGTRHGIGLSLLLHHFFSYFVFGFENLCLNVLGGHHIKLIKNDQLLLQKSNLIIKLRQRIFQHLVLLCDFYQALVKLLLVILIFINFFYQILGVFDEWHGLCFCHLFFKFWNDDL